MTPLTTPILDFSKVISALTTPITIPTLNPSLAKTSLDKIQVPTNSHEAWATCGRTNKVMGEGGGDWGILFSLPFPLYECFRSVYVYCLGLLGVHEFFFY